MRNADCPHSASKSGSCSAIQANLVIVNAAVGTETHRLDPPFDAKLVYQADAGVMTLYHSTTSPGRMIAPRSSMATRP